MITEVKTLKLIPEEQISYFLYKCDKCGLKFETLEKATEHYISFHIKQINISNVGKAFFVTSIEEGNWIIIIKDKDFFLFHDPDKTTIVPGKWHLLFFEERPFRSEYDTYFWLAPIENQIPILMKEKQDLLKEIAEIDMAIKDIYEAIENTPKSDTS
jgi:hypothetical protein